LIALALIDLSRVLYGTHIRIFELTRNLGIPLIHSTTQMRVLKYLKKAPQLLKTQNILLFGARERFFDDLTLSFAKNFGTRIIYDAADLPHLQNFYFAGGTINESLARKFYSLVRVADILVIISKSAKALFDKDAIKNKEVVILPNASDPDFFRVVPLPKEPKTILYVGGYAAARGVDDLVSAFNILKERHREIRLRLVGPNMPLTLRSESVSVECDKTYRDMAGIQASAYACVIPHKRNPYMDAALPVKLYDSMASARPVITTNCPEVEKIVVEEHCGLVSHDNPNSLAHALEDLIDHPKLAEELGQKGREAIEKRHSWRKRAESLRKQLSD
jgi:glycosyltransferase involved in cell wall biosynthesis